MALIPHFAALSPKLASILQDNPGEDAARNLRSLYISQWDFDENWYLANNPDLAPAIPSENFPSAWHHFRAVGYFEGRLPIEPHVDATWYMSTYSDVASAIIEGTFSGAFEHFVTVGYREGRLPADPGVDPSWYGARYMPHSIAPDAKACTKHFLRFGYLTGAVPARPRQ